MSAAIVLAAALVGMGARPAAAVVINDPVIGSFDSANPSANKYTGCLAAQLTAAGVELQSVANTGQLLAAILPSIPGAKGECKTAVDGYQETLRLTTGSWLELRNAVQGQANSSSGWRVVTDNLGIHNTYAAIDWTGNAPAPYITLDLNVSSSNGDHVGALFRCQGPSPVDWHVDTLFMIGNTPMSEPVTDISVPQGTNGACPGGIGTGNVDYLHNLFCCGVGSADHVIVTLTPELHFDQQPNQSRTYAVEETWCCNDNNPVSLANAGDPSSPPVTRSGGGTGVGVTFTPYGIPTSPQTSTVCNSGEIAKLNGYDYGSPNPAPTCQVADGHVIQVVNAPVDYGPQPVTCLDPSGWADLGADLQWVGCKVGQLAYAITAPIRQTLLTVWSAITGLPGLIANAVFCAVMPSCGQGYATDHVDFGPLSSATASLSTVFPFSVPWDIGRWLSILDAAPQAWVFTATFHMPMGITSPQLTFGPGSACSGGSCVPLLDATIAGSSVTVVQMVRWFELIPLTIGVALALRRYMPSE